MKLKITPERQIKFIRGICDLSIKIFIFKLIQMLKYSVTSSVDSNLSNGEILM